MTIDFLLTCLSISLTVDDPNSILWPPLILPNEVVKSVSDSVS